MDISHHYILCHVELNGYPFYLGSLCGLGPGEPGAHGPWLINIAKDGNITSRHVPIAPLRWSLIDMSVDPAHGPEDIGDQLLDAAETRALDLQKSESPPRAVGVRIRLVGSTRHFQAIETLLQRRRWADAVRSAGDTVVFINKVINQLSLECDLEELARGDDPPALLAGKLLALKAGGEQARPILDAARTELRGLKEEVRWSPLAESRYYEDPLEDARLAASLLDTGTAALDHLLGQRPVPGDGSMEADG